MSNDELAAYKRKVERLELARKAAETLLEEKSLELYIASQQLKQNNTELESRVEERTTELRTANKALRDAVKRDAATGLYNSSHFTSILDSHCRKLPTGGKQFALVYFDLDGFKAINDTYGHYVGDEAILELSKILAAVIPAKAFASRHGGDEFIVLLPNCNEDDAAEVAAKCLHKMRSSPLAGRSVIITASIGIAVAPFAGQTSRELYIASDAAMYEAKNNGRNQYHIFSEKLKAKIEGRGRLANALKTAIADQRIAVAFQPQFTVQGVLVGAEALARWEDQEFGTVRPDTFIQLAEETGQIRPLGDVILDKTLSQLTDWLDRKLLAKTIKVAINVSVFQLISEDFMVNMKKRLEARPDLSRHIEIELTETIMVRDFKLANKAIDTLRRWGLSVALDDFGTAHSGLHYLCKLPIDKIKIDRMFTKEVLSSPKTEAVVKGVMTLAKELEIEAVVEGVETQAELDALASFGTASYQGFLFSKPLNAASFEALLVSGRVAVPHNLKRHVQ